MPTTTDNWDIVIPSSDLEPADLYGVATRLGESVDEALTAPYVDLRASAVTSITHNPAANIKVDLATTTHNDTDFFTVSASVVTIVQAGLFNLNARSGFASMSGTNNFKICLNGLAFGNEIGYAFCGAAMTSQVFGGSIVVLRYALSVGDTIQIGAYQNQSAGSAACNTRNDSRLLIDKVG